jgi:hypothetical protein
LWLLVVGPAVLPVVAVATGVPVVVALLVVQAGQALPGKATTGAVRRLLVSAVAVAAAQVQREPPLMLFLGRL